MDNQEPQIYLIMCSACKAIRLKNKSMWMDIESVLIQKILNGLNGTINISHGLCPGCCQYLYGPEMCSETTNNSRKIIFEESEDENQRGHGKSLAEK